MAAAISALAAKVNEVLELGQHPSTLVSSSPEWKALEAHAKSIQST